jgi:hypothetical protein
MPSISFSTVSTQHSPQMAHDFSSLMVQKLSYIFTLPLLLAHSLILFTVRKINILAIYNTVSLFLDSLLARCLARLGLKYST